MNEAKAKEVTRAALQAYFAEGGERASRELDVVFDTLYEAVDPDRLPREGGPRRSGQAGLGIEVDPVELTLIATACVVAKAFAMAALRDSIEDYELLRQLQARRPRPAAAVLARGFRRFDRYTKKAATFREARRRLLEAF